MQTSSIIVPTEQPTDSIRLSKPKSESESQSPIILEYHPATYVINDPVAFFKDFFFSVDLKTAKQELNDSMLWLIGEPSAIGHPIHDFFTTVNIILTLFEDHILIKHPTADKTEEKYHELLEKFKNVSTKLVKCLEEKSELIDTIEKLTNSTSK